MKVLLVFAHPEPRSLNGDADFPLWPKAGRFVPGLASKQGFAGGSLTADVQAEIDKLLWADMLILQFPLWWYTMPAILKGWVDRVFAYGFAYGIGEHSDRRWGDRFGQGTLAGKRAMLIVTAGGWEEHYAARGINGPIDDLLFPINHGILYYPGYAVLPPFVVYRVDRFGETDFEAAAEALRQRMRMLETTAPIPYRIQNGGDYVIPTMQLLPELGGGTTGFALHRKTG